MSLSEPLHLRAWVENPNTSSKKKFMLLMHNV